MCHIPMWIFDCVIDCVTDCVMGCVIDCVIDFIMGCVKDCVMGCVKDCVVDCQRKEKCTTFKPLRSFNRGEILVEIYFVCCIKPHWGDILSFLTTDGF